MKRFRRNAKTIIYFLPLVLMLLSLGCASARVLHHEPSEAAIEAEKFAEVAFVQHNSQEAYDALSNKTKKGTSPEEFASIIVKIHPTGYPSKVSPLEYEPILGQPAMNIYLQGQNEKEYFYYRLVMEGTADEGYRVGGFFRGNGPYSESSLRRSLTENNSANRSK